MRLPLMGVGMAGLVSAMAFTFFPLDSSFSLGASDFQNTFGLLAVIFSTILLVGLAAGSRVRRTRSARVGSGSLWSRTCPRCGHRATKRTSFCPCCGYMMD